MPKKSNARKMFGVYEGHQHPIRVAFRTNFRALRIAANESGYGLAEKMGISQGYVSELESANDDKTPDLFMLYRIAAHFMVPAYTLLIPGLYSGGIDLDRNLNEMTDADYAKLEAAIVKVVNKAKARIGEQN